MITRQAAIALTEAQDARERVKRGALAALPGTGSRCAATLSLWLQEFGILPKGKIYTWTGDLLNHLPKDWTRITDPRDVQPLDIMVSKDNNHNGAPDHVGIILSEAGPFPKVFVEFLDNQNQWIPYTRNLGPGPKTPMAYALRIPWPTEGSLPPDDSNFDMLADLKLLYAAALSHDQRHGGIKALAAFNRIRRLPGMPPV